MNVWHKQTTRQANGKRIVILSKRLYGTLRLASGKSKQVPLTLDASTSKVLLRRLQTQEDEHRASGVPLHVQERERSVKGVLTEYEQVLRSRGNVAQYVTDLISRLQKLLDATRAKTIADLNASRITSTLTEWRRAGRIGAKTSNHYVTAAKGFSRWLYRERKTPDDLLAILVGMNAEADRRRLRRALTMDEFNTLTLATQQSTRCYRGSDWRFCSTDRDMLYTIAVYTGLRAREIASLTKASFDFEDNDANAGRQVHQKPQGVYVAGVTHAGRQVKGVASGVENRYAVPWIVGRKTISGRHSRNGT